MSSAWSWSCSSPGRLPQLPVSSVLPVVLLLLLMMVVSPVSSFPVIYERDSDQRVATDVSPRSWMNVVQTWRQLRLFGSGVASISEEEADLIDLIIECFAANKPLLAETTERSDSDAEAALDAHSCDPVGERLAEMLDDVRAATWPNPEWMHRSRRESQGNQVNESLDLDGNVTTSATPESDSPFTTTQVSGSGVNLQELEFIGVLAAVFSAGFVVGALATRLMTVRRQRKRNSIASPEVFGNPMLRQSEDALASSDGHRVLRALPSTISAVTHRFQRPGMEEGYFVPDEGWAVINANFAVEDLNFPSQDSPVMALNPDQGNTSGHVGHWSPQPSDQSLPAVEYSEQMQSMKASGLGAAVTPDTRLMKFAGQRSHSITDSVTDSIPEDRVYHPSNPGRRLSVEKKHHPGPPVPMDAASIQACKENQRTHFQQFAGHADQDVQPRQRRSNNLRRASSASQMMSMESHDADLQAAGQAELTEISPLHMSRGSRSFHMESQSDPGSPQDRANDSGPGLARGQKSAAVASPNFILHQQHHHADLPRAGRGPKCSSHSHISAPPQLQRRRPSSQLSLGGLSSQQELNKLSNVDHRRVLSWVESQEHLVQEDFEVNPSDLDLKKKLTSEAPANVDFLAESQSLVNLPHSSEDRVISEGASAACKSSSSVPVNQNEGESLGSLPKHFGRSGHPATEASLSVKSSSVGVLFPPVTQTLESQVKPFTQHRRTPSLGQSGPTPPAQLLRDSHQTVGGGLLTGHTRTARRSSIIPVEASAEQRLSMHPVDVIEMDRLSHTQGNSPPSPYGSF